MDIKKIRQLTGMTQREFGEYLGIPQRSIENWEGGHRTPPTYLVELIKYKILKEELGMIKDIIKALKSLNEEDLLNEVGVALVEYPERFSETFIEMKRYFEGMSFQQIIDTISTSSLVGHDAEKAIEEWIFEPHEMDIIIDVDVQKVGDEYIATNGRWTVNKNGIYRNHDTYSEKVGDMEDVPETIERTMQKLA